MCCCRVGGEFFVYNQVNDIVQVGVGYLFVGDVGIFIYYYDLVVDQEQVLQVVGNQNYVYFVSGNVVNEFQNCFNFCDGQCGGGFIYNQYFWIKGCGVGDGYSLVLVVGEILYQQLGIWNGDFEFFKYFFGIGVYFGFVEKGDVED